jgi:outer membrane protein OmpA-like peptidoglycan-associated protein
MNALSRLAVLALLLAPGLASAELVETEIENVSAEIAELRTSGGVTRLAVRYQNNGAKEAWTDIYEINKIAIVDVKSKKKYAPIKDASGWFMGGPINDEIGGGRIYVKMPPGQEGMAWTFFDAIPAGTVVSVDVPQMFPFDDVTVTEGPGTLTNASTAKSIPPTGLATLLSAKRADQAVKARLKLNAADPAVPVDLRSSYFEYEHVYLFDPLKKRKYPLLKNSAGGYEATPQHENLGGKSFLPDWRKGPILMSLTFQAPPDDVTSVDLVLNDFLPIEAVALEGLGGAGADGIAAAGTTLGLEGALKELQAVVTPQEIKIDLSADVLFDFDKADLKPAAEAQLQNLLTVVNSRPNASVSIEGHTDVRGEAPYNQALSQRRAESVQRWLTGHGVGAARITATGAGESRPVKSGSTEADHQANRRVEIRIKGS